MELTGIERMALEIIRDMRKRMPLEPEEESHPREIVITAMLRMFPERKQPTKD